MPKDIWTTQIYRENFSSLSAQLNNKKVAIFIGSHNKFTQEQEATIGEFAQSYGIPVFCDHTANYHGKNKILISQINKVAKDELSAEIIIDIGNICGEYNSVPMFANAKIWRVSEDSDFHCRYNVPTEKLFICSENIPKQSSLHLAILNSLRSMNYFELDKSIDTVCNVGGFGIDGACSTLIGQSLANKKKKCFGLVGDLAFFYDMNILGNRHIMNNVRLMLVNNNKGAEFHVAYIGQIANKEERLDNLVAAGGHYLNGAKAWAESCGFKYLSAKNKDEFDSLIKDFCLKDYDKPVLFECFTNSVDEDMGIRTLTNG